MFTEHKSHSLKEVKHFFIRHMSAVVSIVSSGDGLLLWSRQVQAAAIGQHTARGHV